VSLAVEHTVEYERVRDLPRRVLSIETAREWAEYLTSVFSLRAGAELRPWQSAAIAEAVDCGGAWMALPVGLGKTIISALLPLAMHARRTMLLVPGTLLAKTHADFASFVDVWRMSREPLMIVSREKISVETGADLLDGFAPDLIIIDESYMLANPRSSASLKIGRYVRNHSDVRVVAMDGTPSRKTIMSYWHVIAWCLGDGAPLPLIESEARMWALVLDDHRGVRPDPGPLGGSPEQACAWYRQRLIETPGVVIVDEDSCTAPLTVRMRIAREDPILDQAFTRFLIEQESPGGNPVSDPLSRWLLDGQLGLGLYSRWNPEPPDAWRNARRAVARFVRERIEASTRSTRPLDSEAPVLRRYAEHAIVREWNVIKPTFGGSTETVWISRSTLDECLTWLREIEKPGIVWCGSVPFGEALAREARLPYYGAGGVTVNGFSLIDAPPGTSFIASWKANMKGFNLQSWSRQLITMPPQSAVYLEQIIGRSHRSGQDDHVIVDVLVTSGGTLDLFDATFRESEKVRERESLTQKILRADIVRAEPKVNQHNEFRWARKGSK